MFPYKANCNDHANWIIHLIRAIHFLNFRGETVTLLEEIRENFMLNPADIVTAHQRIENYIHHTPILTSDGLDAALGHHFYFKYEGAQKVGAFKMRGALNTLLKRQEDGTLPDHIIAYSSGNHAQAAAKAAQILGIKATIYMPSHVSKVKASATESYGAELILCQTRQEAEALAHEAQKKGAFLLPPYDHDDVILGQGTACLEALQKHKDIDAIFAPCGGGGLLSGTYLAKEYISPKTLCFGAEPLSANDAAITLRTGKIYVHETSPDTIADGAMTLYVSERTLSYLKCLDGFFEISEQDIIYWTQWLSHLLKVAVEPTSACAMAGAMQWLKTQKTPQKILIILSGGNISAETYRKIWKEDYLDHFPFL